jgi:23S rRNA pseudouridine2604 synthase
MMNTRLGQLFGKGPKKGQRAAPTRIRVPGAFGNKIKKKLDPRSTPKSKVKTGPKGPTPTPRIFDGSIRINKRIKDLGLASRRDADRLIETKKVLINGVVATIGSKVRETDKIEIVNHADNYQYYSFYKPKDVVSHSPQYGETEVKNFFKNWDHDHLTVVGRLDKHSEGLMLVTNDKRLVERILDPRFGHEREYEVTVQEKLSKNIVNLFSKGFDVRGRFTAKPAKVELVDNFKFRITLTEGKKHQIRLMTNELHYTVSKLKRTNIMNLNLRGIEPGKFKEIKKEEVKKLLKLVGLN